MKLTSSPLPAVPAVPAVPALPQGLAFKRALTRGRIEGLQSALRLLTQQAEPSELSDLRRARLSLCDRLQAQYVQFLSDPAAAPQGLTRASHGIWRRSQLRQLLQEDLDWVRSLPGDHQDLAGALHAGLAQSAPHPPR